MREFVWLAILISCTVPRRRINGNLSSGQNEPLPKRKIFHYCFKFGKSSGMKLVNNFTNYKWTPLQR